MFLKNRNITDFSPFFEQLKYGFYPCALLCTRKCFVLNIVYVLGPDAKKLLSEIPCFPELYAF